MSFFENTRKPQGFGGKLMTKMMNSGHSRLSQWGFSNTSVNPDAEVLDVGCGGGANIAVWLNKCRKVPPSFKTRFTSEKHFFSSGQK